MSGIASKTSDRSAVAHTVDDVSTFQDTQILTDGRPALYELTPSQEVTFSKLLCIGGPRPFSPPGLDVELSALIEEGTADALARWTEKSMWISKSGLFSILRCEGAYMADRESGRPTSMHPATAVGLVSHRAIQIAHTHPRLSPSQAVDAGLEGALSESAFEVFWETASIGVQSDLLMQMTSRVTLFLDSWPRLNPAWTPRFEESIQAKIGKLTIAARPDLILGRPRSNLQQNMLLCDFKTGALQDDHHYDEAQFYALVSLLRFGVAPYRSTVYSLASGTYTPPDVTASSLHAAALKVIAGVNAMVDVMTERREATLTGGPQCRWCPLKETCATGQAALAVNVKTT
jgi:hypothetical protein